MSNFSFVRCQRKKPLIWGVYLWFFLFLRANRQSIFAGSICAEFMLMIALIRRLATRDDIVCKLPNATARKWTRGLKKDVIVNILSVSICYTPLVVNLSNEIGILQDTATPKEIHLVKFNKKRMGYSSRILRRPCRIAYWQINCTLVPLVFLSAVSLFFFFVLYYFAGFSPLDCSIKWNKVMPAIVS